jgi:hypothetical protein
MRRISRIALMAMALLVFAQPARADLLLTASEDPSSTANLNALTPGQQVTFDVNLSGLTGGQQIGTLGATLIFDQNLLGTPLAINPGAIIPDTSGFVTSPGGGVADASYSFIFANSSAPITSNGGFFTFTVAAQNTSGSGSVSFSFVGASDTSFNNITINAGSALPFQVVATSTVPEPSSFLVVVFVGTVVSMCQGRRWLNRRRTPESQ